MASNWVYLWFTPDYQNHVSQRGAEMEIRRAAAEWAKKGKVVFVAQLKSMFEPEFKLTNVEGDK